MTVRATYGAAQNDWTQALDRALSEWSAKIIGEAELNIQLTFETASALLAITRPNFLAVGTKADGTPVFLSTSAAKFQGYSGLGPDILMNINPNYSYSFNGPEPGKYSFFDIAKHELGHGFYAISEVGPGKTPYGLFVESLPQGSMSDINHPSDPNSLMFSQSIMNTSQTWDDFDLRAMSASGIPTVGDDTFYLIPSATITSSGGHDKAIWLGTLDQYDAKLSGIEVLELGGANPLTGAEQDVYRLYRAAFDRVPDLNGFQFWKDDQRPIEQKAAAFAGSPEFLNINGADQSRREYISSLYEHILHRPAEQAGLDYWDGRHDLDTVGLLLNVGLSAENEINTPIFSL